MVSGRTRYQRQDVVAPVRPQQFRGHDCPEQHQHHGHNAVVVGGARYEVARFRGFDQVADEGKNDDEHNRRDHDGKEEERREDLGLAAPPYAQQRAEAVYEKRPARAVPPLPRAGVALIAKVENLGFPLPHACPPRKMSVSVRRAGASRRSRAPASTAASRTMS